jgi:hypothetical protein
LGAGRDFVQQNLVNKDGEVCVGGEQQEIYKKGISTKQLND